MNQEVIWSLDPTYILQDLCLFNWGGFSGTHRASVDALGTAVIGPTGSGKTTLVDALMTLICALPKYNLASTGGHESDRDLVSYVRGVAGAGDGGGGQAHIARPGKTVTGISATLNNGENIARLGALFYFEGSSSSPSDMKKLWIFTTSAEQTLEAWLTVLHEGGMAALKKLDKSVTGIWTYPSKKAYLARIRDFFEVRENAFNLLNRAAGLKQLNSIDEIFRELVLDDTSQFERAREVADSFDDLTGIHEELEIAKRQQRSLEPVKTSWERFLINEAALAEKDTLSQILPLWFGEQGYQLWNHEHERLSTECQQAQVELTSALQQYESREQIRDTCKEAYLQLGGSNIQTLEALIAEKQKRLQRSQQDAAQYQWMVGKLELPDTLDLQTFSANQAVTASRLARLETELAEAEHDKYAQGVREHQAQQTLKRLKNELIDVERRPGSNIPPEFHHFRLALAAELGLAEDALPFVAELVQVKEDEQSWRGAIERAIGTHRLRILVPPASEQAALHWINHRHNQLHVRILTVLEPRHPPEFLEDGFSRKLAYKEHAYRQAVKVLIAAHDRHCVDSPEVLKHTPHAMTCEGLMSGKSGFYDKQDQKRLDQDWMTGFNNHDRLTFLQQQIAAAQADCRELYAQLEQSKARASAISQQKILLEQLQHLDFDRIDTPSVELALQTDQQKLLALTSPGSDMAAAKTKLEQAEDLLKEVWLSRDQCLTRQTALQKDQQYAATQKQRAFRKAEAGLQEHQRSLAQNYFPEIQVQQIHDIADLENQAQEKLQSEIDTLKSKRTQLEKDLVKYMSDAQKEDRGALSEVGRDLEDVPQYLQRLTILIEEALPEKRQRFKDYLNRSSDEGVTQLLMTIDSEVERIEEKLEEVNNTLRRVDFQSGRYLQLVSGKVIHESLRSFNKTRTRLASARFAEDEGESQYKVLQEIVTLLRDACDRNRTLASKALLDPRFRLEFKVSVIERSTGNVIETRSGSQGGSGGEKEIIASYVLTASLSYALCPDGSSRPLFGTIVLDEAFSRSSHAVAGRIIAALKEFALHALFITPNKEMRLLRKHTRSAIVVHRRGVESTLTPISWQELDVLNQKRAERQNEITS